MTCREKLAIEHPEDIDETSFGGCNGCPSSYGYMSEFHGCDGASEEKCTKCWDSEISENEETFMEENRRLSAKTAQLRAQMEFDTAVKSAVIKDSGDRTQFESGAVRDMREGKGRCDLMPLMVVYHHLKLFKGPEANPIKCICGFQECGDTRALYEAIHLFCMGNDAWDTAFTMFLEVAKHFEEGAKKYGENNWQKGIPVHCYIDSAVRHYLKWLRGDKDEPHDRAFVWNLMCCIWEVDYHEYGKEKQE